MEKKKEANPRPSFGEHIFVQRSICYSHHGIYVGNDKVIHYQTPMENGHSDPKSCRVIESDLKTFLGDDNNWYLFRYGVNEKHAKLYPKGTYTSKECDEPKVVVQRAQQALKDGFSHFNIVGNNCEDFANYCKTGQRSMESAQFSEALERVAVARRAMANGYRSPLVYAGCVMGLFTLKDFSNPPVNRIPCSSGSESVRCTCPDEENDSKENTDNDEDDEEREGKNEEIVENTETDTYTNNNKDETNDRHDESRDLDVNSANQQNSGSMLTTNKSGANSSSRKKVHFCIP